MSYGSTTRESRRSRPDVELLEGRQLLSGAAHRNRFGKWENLIIHDKDLSRFLIQKNNPVPPGERRFAYDTPDGARVTITLYGKGDLTGSSVDPDGGLNLRFKGTDENSGIIGTVKGGSGHAPLRSLIHANLPAQSVSGIGSSVVRVVNLKDFDLVDGGRLNLTGGVKTLFLNSVGENTQVSLRELPQELLDNASTSNVTNNGVTFGFAVDVFGARTLTSTSGVFIAGAETLPGAPGSGQEGDVPTPTGLVATINHINGPSRAEQGLGNPQLFGYDPVTNELVAFNVSLSGTDLVAQPGLRIANALPAPTPDAGVSMSRYQGNLVVLVSDGTRVYAYNPLDGSAVGSFSLAGSGLTNPKRLGTVDSFTVIGDSTGGVSGNGQIRIINVTSSLDTGTVVTVGSAFEPQREFGLSGGMGSIPGSSTLFAAGGAHFDTYQPLQYQLGVASLSPSTSGFRESARNPLTVSSRNITTGPHGETVDSKNQALGNLDQSLALVTNLQTDAGTGQVYNEVSLFNPQTYARLTTVKLFNPNQLSGLSSSFYPDLRGTALIDIQGDVQSFRANDAQGMVLNDLGTLNLLKIHRVDDSTVIGYPLSHVEIPIRNNVELISTSRAVGVRGGVTVQPNRRPTGPLSLP